jgi:aspartyl protease family protein
MSGDDWVTVAWFVMAFTLVISAVAAHRIPAGTMLKMAAIWVVIFAAVFLMVLAWQAVT